MTKTDIYNASKNIFPGLPDEETFAADMADSEKASRAFENALRNKDKYDEMGVALPESVEEFQAIVTGDPKKKSTSQGQSGNGGSTQTQQSSGSQNAQSSQDPKLKTRAKEMGWGDDVQGYINSGWLTKEHWEKEQAKKNKSSVSGQGPRVFQPKRVFNSIEDINNYAGYLEDYKNDPAAKAEKEWFHENYANITDEFLRQGGKPLTIQGPPVKQEKTASIFYDKSTLPTTERKSSIDNKEFLRTEQPKKVIPRMSEEELMGQVISDAAPAQDALQAPANIQQAVVKSEQQSKREQEGAKVQGMSAQQIIDQQKKEDEIAEAKLQADKKKEDIDGFYNANYPKIESLINNGFGTRSNDIDFTKLNVNSRSELEYAYGLLEQDYLEYLQKVDPQEYERVKNEIQGIRSKKGADINTGERQVIDQFRAKAMEMHNLVNGYVMHEIEKNYDLPAYFGAASAMSIQIDALDKQIQALNIDPSGKGVSPAKAQQYQKLVDQRNKLTTEYNGLDEKFAIPTEVVAKYQDVANRYIDNGVVQNQLNNLDTELAAKTAANMKAAQERFDKAASGDYSTVGEFGRTYTNTVGRAAVDLVTSMWDVIGEKTGDTDYDIWDQIANFGRGYNFEKEKMFGTAQDFSIDRKEYSDLPLAYRMTGLTGSALGSISLSAAGAVLTGGLGLGSTVGGGMLMLGSSMSDGYNEALRNGYSGQEAANYAITMAGIEFAVESLFPDFEFFKTTEGKKQLLRAVANSKTPKEAFEKLMVGLPENVLKEFKTIGGAAIKEGVIEEGGSQLISDIVKSKFNEQNKDKGQFEVFKGEDYLNSVVGGALGASSASIIGRLASPKMPHEESWIFQAATNPDILSLSERNSIIVPDEMKDVINTFQTIDDAMKSKPGYENLSDDQKAHVVSEIQRMKYLEEQNKKVGIDDKATQDEITNIKSSVETILQNALKPKEEKENAVQEPSTEEVLPREQGTITETGGQPQGMGQDVQGQEVTQEGQEVSQEGVKPEEVRKQEVVNQPLGELPIVKSSFKDALGGVGLGYLPHNIWTNKKLNREGEVGLFANLKGQFDRWKRDAAYLYFLNPNLSKEDLDNAEEAGNNHYKIYDKDFDDKNASYEESVLNDDKNVKENTIDKGVRVSQAGEVYRLHDPENTDLVGYLKVTPELFQRISDPNISEEEANKILFEEAGVPMSDDIYVHINEHDLSQYKTKKESQSEGYVAKLEETKKQNPKDFWSVSAPSVEDAKSGTLINVEGGQAIVDKSGDISGLYKFAESEQKGVGDKLVQKAIDAGGVKLDNFAKPDLMKIYLRNGFRVVSRMPFNEEYAPEGWDEKEHGKPDVVAMVYDPDNLLDIEEKQFTKDQYDEAIEYRDTYMDSQKDAYGDRSEPQFDKKELSTEYLDALEKSGLTVEDVEAWKEKNRVRQQQSPMPIVRDAAQKLDEGEITSEEFRKVVRDNQPIIPFTKVPELPTVQDIISSLDLGKFKEGSGAGVVGVNKEFKDGDLVATRLDIPAYNNFDTWVVSIHDAKNEGKILGYAQTAVLKNVDFIINPRQSLSIAYQKLNARGEKTAKTTIARMRGSWVNESPESVHERAKKLLNDPQWVQVGMNPYRHSGFYDKKTGEPLVSAEELIQVGALVLAKNPVMTTWDDPMFATKNLKGDIIFFDKNVESESTDPYTFNEETLINEMNNSGVLNPEIDLEETLNEVGELDTDSIKGRNNLSSQPDVISIDYINGKPIMLTISDELRVGNVKNPINGKLINRLFGGLLFPWSKGNEGYAWAYTSEKAATDVLKVAKKIYKDNKSLFPDGMIPVAVVKMGKDAMVSNEAVLRQIIQNLQDGKISSKSKAKAYELLKEKIKSDYEKLKAKAENKSEDEEISASQKNLLKGYSDIIALFKKSKDFDSFLIKSEMLNISTRPVVIKNITTGSTGIAPKKFTLGKNINAIVTSLMEGLDASELKRLNLGHLVATLTEPALSSVPNRHVISIIEVDAKQNEPIRSSTHPNYPYVLKGRGVGVLKDTVHIGRVLPATYGNAISKLINNYEAKESSKPPTESTIWSNALPAALNNVLFRNKPISQAEMEANKLIGYLQLAFPNTQFFTDAETWSNILNDPGVKKYLKKGDVVYGLTKDGKVYLNPELMNSNTPIHEAGHIWLDVIENLEPELFKKGMDLASEVAPDLGMSSKTNRDKKEILAKLIGDRGESVVNSAKKSKVKEWLLAVWNYVKSKFKSIRNLSPEQIQDLTMAEFLDGALADILGGEKAFDQKKTSKTKSETQFSKSSQEVEDAINQLVDAEEKGGAELLAAQKEVSEKLGEEGKKIAEIDRNFDKLADELGFIKTCII